MVPSRLRATYIIPAEAAAERALEMTILALITVNGEKITEGAPPGANELRYPG